MVQHSASSPILLPSLYLSHPPPYLTTPILPLFLLVVVMVVVLLVLVLVLHSTVQAVGSVPG